MKVANRKCIRNLSIRGMQTTKLRNMVAILAIALTTVLFTSLFTIVLSIVYGFEQSNFRQVGGYVHCGLKSLTEEQFEEFKSDPHIAEYGKRLFIGTPADACFRKANVEISSIDQNYAKFTYVNFAQGGLPAEHSCEAAADTRVLSLLGISPKIGEEFTLTFLVDDAQITETFILCGFWEYDAAMPANHVFLPFSRAEEIFGKTGITKGADGITGTLSLDILLKSGSAHIEKDVREIIEDHGFQWEDSGLDNYIRYGVNWGYVSAQMNHLFDSGTVSALIAVLLLIFITGHLIIYNVFRISVSNDIRYYGLLKTIGTTGRQIRRILLHQAALLSVAGIPLGLLIGYGVGAALSPVVLNQLNNIPQNTLSANPLIFAAATLFSLFTVFFSCLEPGRIAAKVSPIEALRYTESGSQKSFRRSRKGASVLKMAFANLSKSKGRTSVTLLSLSLAIVLLNVTFVFADGFDMDKYLRRMPVDFIIASPEYLGNNGTWNTSVALPENVISMISSTEGVANLSATYGTDSLVNEFIPESHLRNLMDYADRDVIEETIKYTPQKDGLFCHYAMLYGMEKSCLDKLTVLDGDLSKLCEDGNYIAAVYLEDDYDNPRPDTHWAKVGDTVTLRYHDSSDHVFLDMDTKEIYETAGDVPRGAHIYIQPVDAHDQEYEVAALVTVPYALSYRYYGFSDQYILNAEILRQNAKNCGIMYLAFDAADGFESDLEAYVLDYSQNAQHELSYESKTTYAEGFRSFQSMFVILGAVLSFIVGLIGVLNFTNTLLSGIFARHREFAVLQSIGMTGKQLKSMLFFEGLIYTLGAAAISLFLVTAFSPPTKLLLERMFWFFSFRFTVFPVLLLTPVFMILGVLIPFAAYQSVSRKPIVERLRETE